MKTIYNTYIEVTSQEQANRLKQMCINNDLPIWEDEIAFEMQEKINAFEFCIDEFYITSSNNEFSFPDKYKITENQFLKLLQDE